MNLKGVSKETWVRIVVLFIVFANQISVSFFNFQLVPFTDEQLYTGISTVLTLATAVWAGWKNNSLTHEAQQADAYMKNLKRR